MARPRTGFSSGHSHWIDEEGRPLCKTRVGHFEEGTVGGDGFPSCSKCRTKYARPCPFCGGEPTFFKPQETGDPGSLWCAHCNIEGPDRDGHRTHKWKDIHGKEWSQEQPVHHETRLQVYNAWNRRTEAEA